MADIQPLDSAQTCIIGCGGCGSQIAAYFDKTPSFLIHRPWQMYPFRCAAMDTAQKMEEILLLPPWDWHNKEDIHIIPTATEDSVIKRISQSKSFNSKGSNLKALKTLQQNLRSGLGQFPFVGTLTAEEYLNIENSFGKILRTRLINRRFTEGALLITNSLTGGTGTGFAPVVPDFLSEFFHSKVVLNLSIIPQLSVVQQQSLFFPKNIIYGLYKLAHSERVDAVILADNEVLTKYYECREHAECNSLLHEILAPALLAATGKYDYPYFGKHGDFADMFRYLRRDRGFGEAEFCTLSYATKNLPPSVSFRLKTPSQKERFINDWLWDLVTLAAEMTTIGQIDMKNISSALGFLCGPPEFFNTFMGKKSKYFSKFEEYMQKIFTPLTLASCLQFADAKKVQLSVILSGVSPSRLEKLYMDVIPKEEQKNAGTLMHRIRNTNSDVVEDLMLKGIRESLGI
jgi:hypothetical protein